MSNHLKRDYFKQETVFLAKDLIGKVLVKKTKSGLIKGIISETEAYTQEDPACHTYSGIPTHRTKLMFGKPGVSYIYLIYGMYHCFNIVTEAKGRGCAVLIRSVIPFQGQDIMITNRHFTGKNLKNLKNLCNGPGKLTLAYQVDMTKNGIDLCDDKAMIYVEDSENKPHNIIATPRIGISKGKELLWRFHLKS